jgi:phage regulator Rha-like protein
MTPTANERAEALGCEHDDIARSIRSLAEEEMPE